MKILYLQLPTSHLGAKEIVYPLGLSRLVAQTPDHHQKATLDMNIATDPWVELKVKLQDFTPELVALSFRNIDPLAGIQSSYISSLKTAGRMIRLLLPHAKLIAGGPAYSLFPQELMELVPEIDFGLRGEGEAAIEQLLDVMEQPFSVPNLVWRSDGKIVCNPPGKPVDLNLLPLPAYQHFCPNDYTRQNSYVAAIGIEGKRGCDLSCGYCVYPHLGGSRMRLRDPKKITDEIELLHKEYKVGLFHFTDGVVNRPVDHFEQICREIISRKLNISWTGFLREDTFTEKTAELAKKSGIVACYFSGDALTDQGLKILNKRMSKQDILNASKISADQNILTMCHFLVNLPFEEDSNHRESIEMMEKILEIHESAGNLGAVIFNTVRLYPGAPLTQKMIRAKLLDPNIRLVYPVYHNPAKSAYVLHELEALCHRAGIFSQLKIKSDS
jgi:putative variant cofactor biosynthesis B12-binding/radical SAM domain protein 1